MEPALGVESGLVSSAKAHQWGVRSSRSNTGGEGDYRRAGKQRFHERSGSKLTGGEKGTRDCYSLNWLEGPQGP